MCTMACTNPALSNEAFERTLSTGMDAKHYDRGELSVGNPPLVELVRNSGSKSLPVSEPNHASAMASGGGRHPR